MTEDPTSEAFFEAKYQRSSDPWQFATSAYEQSRYECITGALSPRRFRRAFEPGCSVGILTERLAAICEKVDAMDISVTAVSRARQRCRSLSGVTVTHGGLPESLPDGMFDLIVLSEIGYYFSEDNLSKIVSRLFSRVPAGGVLLAAHWLGSSPDHLLSGDQVHAIIRGVVGWEPYVSQRYEGFRLDLWRRYDS